MNKITKAIFNSVKKISKRVSKDKYLLSTERDFMVMLYHELKKEKNLKKLIIATEINDSKIGFDKIDMGIYKLDERRVEKVLSYIPGYEIKNYAAIIELKISWEGSKNSIIDKYKKDISKRKILWKKSDNRYFILMSINPNLKLYKKDLECLSNGATIIYSNPILNKLYLREGKDV